MYCTYFLLHVHIHYTDIPCCFFWYETCVVSHFTFNRSIWNLFGVRYKARFIFSRWQPSCPSAICCIIHLFPLRFEMLSFIICCLSCIYKYLGLCPDHIQFHYVFTWMTSYLWVSLDTFQSSYFLASHLFCGFPCTVESLREFLKNVWLLRYSPRCWLKGVWACPGQPTDRPLASFGSLAPLIFPLLLLSTCFQFLFCFSALLMMVFLRLVFFFPFSFYFIIHDILAIILPLLLMNPKSVSPARPELQLRGSR